MRILMPSGRVAEDLTPMLDEVELLPLIGDMLCEGVNRKKPTAGSLDGWGVGGS